MWWALVSWAQNRSRWSMAAAGLLVSALFLPWPILIGPPLLVLGLLVVLPISRGEESLAGKAGTTYVRQVWRNALDALIAVVPIAIVAGLFSIGRMNYVVIAGTGGEVVTPAVKAYGWLFLVLSSTGIVIAATRLTDRTTSRTIALFAGAILVQAGGLYLFARARGNDPYMARKMFYMLLYPQAVGVAIAVGAVWRILGGVSGLAKGGRYGSRALPWAVTVGALIVVTRPLIGAPKSLVVARHPATSLELDEAGIWARDHVDPHCVEYLVGDDNTAYWLHLAVLGNPRRGARTGDTATYELTPALVRWLTPGGLPYAIADLRVVPTDIKDASDIVAQFGPAAVIKRKGPASCGS